MNNTNLPVRVLEVEVESMHDPTCYKTREDPEGRFPKVKIYITYGSTRSLPGEWFPDDTEILEGKTCACQQGHVTFGTWRLPPEGSVFACRDALIAYLNHDDNYALQHPGSMINKVNPGAY